MNTAESSCHPAAELSKIQMNSVAATTMTTSAVAVASSAEASSSTATVWCYYTPSGIYQTPAAPHQSYYGYNTMEYLGSGAASYMTPGWAPAAPPTPLCGCPLCYPASQMYNQAALLTPVDTNYCQPPAVAGAGGGGLSNPSVHEVRLDANYGVADQQCSASGTRESTGQRSVFSLYSSDKHASSPKTSQLSQPIQKSMDVLKSRRSSRASGGGGVGNEHYFKNILYKTELCKNYSEDRGCPRGTDCQFAHGEEELHDPRDHPLYKTAMCNDYQTTHRCPRGEMCFHVHHECEMRKKPSRRSRAPRFHNRSQSSSGTQSPRLSVSRSRTVSTSSANAESGVASPLQIRSRSISGGSLSLRPQTRNSLSTTPTTEDFNEGLLASLPDKKLISLFTKTGIWKRLIRATTQSPDSNVSL